MSSAESRRLRGLPSSWQRPVAESEVDALEGRADALAAALRKRGRECDAQELRHRRALLARVDDLHRHAGDLETLAGLYRALAILANETEPASDGSLVWAQIGALDEDMPSGGHGPAFRETAALRNRAFRALASAVAKYARG